MSCQKRRLAKAVAAIAVGLAVLEAVSWAEQAIVPDEGMPAGEGALSAAAMARAALEGTVSEALAPFSAAADPDALVPSWLEELLGALGPVEAVMTGGNGSIASFTLSECTEGDGVLQQALAACGWQGIPTGLDGCATYVRGEGEGQWLAVSQWSMGQDVVVLVQCA